MTPVYSDIVQAKPSELIAALAARVEGLPHEAARSEQYADLGGYDSQYPRYQDEISHLIGLLKRAHSQIGSLRRHVHDWSEDDYCRTCGADGRA